MPACKPFNLYFLYELDYCVSHMQINAPTACDAKTVGCPPRRNSCRVTFPRFQLVRMLCLPNSEFTFCYVRCTSTMRGSSLYTIYISVSKDYESRIRPRCGWERRGRWLRGTEINPRWIENGKRVGNLIPTNLFIQVVLSMMVGSTRRLDLSFQS
jgi:hypothetical protein